MKGRRDHKRQIGKGARYLLPTREKWTKFRHKLCLNDISLVPVNCKRERNKTGHLTCEQVTHEEICQTKQPSHTAHLAPSYRPSRKKSILFSKVTLLGYSLFKRGWTGIMCSPKTITEVHTCLNLTRKMSSFLKKISMVILRAVYRLALCSQVQI